jgi:leader peptidase (prepilin peptidase) / N-methyltransferase
MILWPPDAFFIACATLLGALIGSFLNVCIYRLPIQRSIVWPASACPSCARQLLWYENIPVASFLALRGRCRTCGATIAWQYPIVEAITAAMFGLGFWYYGPGVLLASRLVFGCFLIVLFVIDLQHQLLPHAITIAGIVVGLVFSFFTDPGVTGALLGILLGGGALYAIGMTWSRLFHRDALGGGDPPMLAMIGAFVGWKMTLVTLMMASFGGTIVGVALMAAGRARFASKLPFGCFLAFGAAAAATIGPAVLDWYLRLLWT